jgi:PAS domain S-box-containing protein
MLNDLLTALNDCVWAVDVNTQKYLFISPSVYDITEYAIEDFNQNKNLWDEIVDPRDIDIVIAAKNQTATPDWTSLTYRVITKSGKIKWIKQKRRHLADEQTGHQVLLSVINDVSDQQQADFRMNHREQFLNSLIDSQTNFLIRIDIGCVFTFANKWFLKTFGHKKSDIIGKHFSVVAIPEEDEICKQAFKNCIKNPGKVVNLKHRKLNKDGNIHWIKWELIGIANQNGQVTEIQGVGQDVTQNIEIEKEIKKAADRLNSFIESITDSFFIVDNNWKYIKINRAFEKVINRSRKEILGSVIWDIFPGIIASAHEDAFRKAMSGQESVQFTEHFKPLNKWFNTTVYPSSEGLTVFVRDITDEKHAQEEIVWTKNNLEALINNTEDMTWSIDRDGRYVYMNTAYRNRITYTTGVGSKEGDDAYRHSGHTARINDEWRSYYRRALLGERYVTRHESPDPKTKEPSYFEVSFNPIYKSTKGEIIGVGCFARDITERLKNEQALIEQNERLKNIASLSSHELRRPVASMLGLIDIIDRKNFSNPDNEQIIDHLFTVSQEIDEVIHLIVNNTFIDVVRPLEPRSFKALL